MNNKACGKQFEGPFLFYVYNFLFSYFGNQQLLHQGALWHFKVFIALILILLLIKFGLM